MKDWSAPFTERGFLLYNEKNWFIIRWMASLCKILICLKRACLGKVLIAALFYKYIDSSFYRELTEKCQELEDLLLMESDKKHIEGDDQKRVLHEIQEKMEKVYHLIDAKKVGNSSH